MGVEARTRPLRWDGVHTYRFRSEEGAALTAQFKRKRPRARGVVHPEINAAHGIVARLKWLPRRREPLEAQTARNIGPEFIKISPVREGKERKEKDCKGKENALGHTS